MLKLLQNGFYRPCRAKIKAGFLSLFDNYILIVGRKYLEKRELRLKNF